ncbi:restriction endonuclease subunit S [Roseburia sp. OF03-24]|uniref:restriction endonuclease subunit S n=1 Tax=Roseburia sp. OF03-24 TaxID=2292367 RepID=UPI000E4B6381|nr:restriction endonuclease subunit S [Roseburia sp. OF03-24]RGX90580.1 restriction endonuclease subunit S [Roseburia sp. OF03-24]
MKYNWTTKKLSEITYINPRESIGKGVVAKKVPMDKLQPFCRDIPEFVFEEYKGGTKFRNGDTIMARITPCLENGKIAKVSILSTDEIGFGSTEYIVFRAIDDVSDADFLYYLICSPLVRNPAIKSMVGSSGRQRVQTDVVANLDVELPPIEEQRKIGGVLKTFDDKIKLNNEINNNLEQQAQAIFANEFLSLDTLPEGWKQASLIDIANYLNGLAMQKYRPTADESGIPVLKIKELRQGCCDDNSELCSPSIKSDYIIHDGDVIFSWSGSLLVDLWCGGICGLNQHLFKVTSSKYDKWFYYAWTKHHLDRFVAVAADKATTMGHIKRDELAKAEVLIPNEADYNRIGALLQPIYDMIISNRIENKKLAATRDTLLPKLMNSEIDMSEVDYE